MSQRQMQEVISQFEKWGYDTRGWSRRTRTAYRRRILGADVWLRQHRDTSVIWAKEADLKAYLWSTTPSAGNRNGIRQSLVGFWSFLVENEYATANIALALPVLPTGRPVPKALTARQARRVEMSAKILGGWLYPLVMLLLYTGIRHEEARTLEWARVELEEAEGSIRFVAKGNKERIVALGPKCTRVLAAWRAEATSPRWVFPSPYNGGSKPVGHSTINRVVHELGEGLGIERLHPHVLRHTYATRLIERGEDIRTVQAAMGHSSVATTSVYLKARDPRVRRANLELEYDRDVGDDDPPASAPAATPEPPKTGPEGGHA